MTTDPAPEQAVQLAVAVVTGAPPMLVDLLACRACGVLLWDVTAHYRHAHPEVRL
jgi:hypothetical protein